MQELVIVTTCDPHAEIGDNHTAREVLWFVGDEPWVIDLCESYVSETSLDAMDELIQRYGRPLSERRVLNQVNNAAMGEATKKTRKQRKAPGGHERVPVQEAEDGRIGCPWPKCSRTYKNKGSLMGHFFQEHGVRYSNWEAEQAGVKPNFFCVCGEPFVSNRALINHMNTKKEGEHRAVDAA